MRNPYFVLLCAASLVAASACNGDDERPPASVDGSSGSSGSGGKKSTSAGSGSQSEAGAKPSPEAGAGVGAGEGGAGGQGIVYETAGAPTFVPGVCDPAMMPGKEAGQELDPGLEGATLLAMTPDERSALLVTGEPSALALHVADRASAADPFEPQEVALPSGYEAATGASLSSDGLTLVLVLSDHSGFGKLTRPARGAAFSTEADVTAFARINAQKPMSGREVGWPVLSSDGGSLYYLSYRELGEGLVVQSTRGSDGRFDIGKEIDPYTLGGAMGAYKRINAVSADQRAIFFFDEATKHAMALFRSRPDSPFYEPVDLGARAGVSPNADCTRLYSSVDGQLLAQDLK